MFDWSKNDLIVLPITLAIIILISLLLYFLLKNKSEKVRMIPIMIITIIMLILEVIKQIRAILTGYSTWTIPLHFCSLFLYFYPLACFTKGKIQEFGKTMSFVCSCWMTTLFYFNPGTIIGSDTTASILLDFSTFHTFIYHHLVILFLLTSLLLKNYNFKKNSLIHVVIGFSIYAVVMIPLAHILQTNFCNILESNIAFMESLRINVGQILYTIIMYILSITGGLTAISVPLIITYCKTNKQKQLSA